MRGITIEIDGDTTKLSKALKSVNGEIRKTQTDLKDVDRLLKLDPTNTVLLEQKQKLLKTAIGDTRDKLDALNQAAKEKGETLKYYDDWKKAYEPLQTEVVETTTKLEKLKDKQKEMQNAGEVDSDAYNALQTEIDETEGKLKSLKKQQEDVNEQFHNPISPEQYDKLQIEIEDTKIKLKDLEKQAINTGKVTATLDTYGEKMKDAGNKITDVGKKIAPVSAAVGGIGVAAVKSAADFEHQMSKVGAISGATNKDMETLKETAIEWGAKTQYSSVEAGKAMEYMGMAGWSAQEMVEGLPGILSLAAAGQEDLGTTSDIVTDALTGFGMAAGEAGHLADIMATAATATNTDVGKMGETFKYISPIAGSLGASAEDTAIAMGLMANAGIKASQAGTSLRGGLLNLLNPSENVQEALDKYGVALQKTEDGSLDLKATMEELRTKLGDLTDVERGAALGAIFGRTASSGWAAVVSASQEDFEDLTQQMYNCTGAAEEMAAEMNDNLEGKITILKGNIENLGIELGTMLVPALTRIVEKIQEFVNWLQSLDESQKQTIIKVAAMVAALGPAIIAFGNIVGAIGNTMKGMSSLIKATKSLGSFIGKAIPAIGTIFKTVFGFIAANPIALLIAAIVGIIVWIAFFGDQAQAILNKFTNWLKSFFVRDWTEIFGPVLGDILNGWSRNILNVIDAVHRILNGIINFIRGVFTGDWERAWRGIKDIFGGVFDGLAAMAKAPINNVIALMNGMIRVVNWAIEQINRVGFDNPFTGAHYGFNLPYLNNIPYLAKGGIIQNRGSAIVGEAGPELLTVNGNQTRVTPLTQANTTNHNTNMGGVNITIYGAPGQDVRELAEIVMEEMQYSADRKGAVFA